MTPRHSAEDVRRWDPLSIAVEGYGMWLCWARNARCRGVIAFRFVIPGVTFEVDFYDEGWAA